MLPFWTIGPFDKLDDANPVLWPQKRLPFVCPMRNAPVYWEENDVFNPAAIVHKGKIVLLYRAEDKFVEGKRTSRIGYAESSDGLVFTRRKEPVLYPDANNKDLEWEGGCEDPRVVKAPDGTFVMTYTAWDRKTARLCTATSKDLLNWTKHGSAFVDGTRDVWSKSGAIVVKRKGSQLVATKVNGRYWMYYGESDVFAASSGDLIHWRHEGTVFKPRPGRFDSQLVEPGPPALLTKSGIVLIYNCRNNSDPSLAEGTYAPGQILLDAKNPMRVLDRTDAPFMKPDRSYEVEGQVNHVCFVEGLVPFKGKWFLYYGTADSKIAVATAPLAPEGS